MFLFASILWLRFSVASARCSVCFVCLSFCRFIYFLICERGINVATVLNHVHWTSCPLLCYYYSNHSTMHCIYVHIVAVVFQHTHNMCSHHFSTFHFVGMPRAIKANFIAAQYAFYRRANRHIGHCCFSKNVGIYRFRLHRTHNMLLNFIYGHKIQCPHILVVWAHLKLLCHFDIFTTMWIDDDDNDGGGNNAAIARQTKGKSAPLEWGVMIYEIFTFFGGIHTGMKHTI